MRCITAQLPSGELVTHVLRLWVYKPRLPDARPARKSLARCFLDDVSFVVALEADRRPVIEAHAQRQAVALEHFLDLSERLLAEVRRTKQLDFRALHEIADVVDVLGLQAVRAANRELELIDRTQQDRIELLLCR